MIFYPTYFSPIIQYIAITKVPALPSGRKEIYFEVEDNYQKQTYRTRCYIYGANGKQLLNIPVQRANHSQKTKDVLIDYSFDWQKQHVKSIESAYRSSPFYEFYEDEINAAFTNKEKYLLDFNLKCHDLITELLQLEKPYSKTDEYIKKPKNVLDFRYLANAKSKSVFNLEPYTQVFSDKNGFIENLSILDLLFMEGTNALNYLENQSLNF